MISIEVLILKYMIQRNSLSFRFHFVYNIKTFLFEKYTINKKNFVTNRVPFLWEKILKTLNKCFIRRTLQPSFYLANTLKKNGCKSEFRADYQKKNLGVPHSFPQDWVHLLWSLFALFCLYQWIRPDPLSIITGS